MSEIWVYSLGTLALWAGLYVWLMSVVKAARSAFNLARDRRGEMISALVWAAVGTSLIAVGFFTTTPSVSAFHFPLIWPVMPFWAWAAAISGVVALVRLVQWYGALTPAAKLEKARSAGIWAAAAVFCFILLKRGDGQLSLVKGSIAASLTTILLVVLLSFATTVAMVAAARKAATLGYAKAFASHAALLTGTLLFGVPFAFLVITSFKEDRDMSSPNGIVWIPKVQQTVPYFNPRAPLYTGTYEGGKVEGTIIENLPDGTVRIDISKPLSIRGTTFVTEMSQLKEIPRQAPIVTVAFNGETATGFVSEDLEDGSKRVEFTEPANLKGQSKVFGPAELVPVRKVGVRWQNYSEALSFMPPETMSGLVYLKNTLILVVLSVIGTLLSSSLAAYAFSRLKFPGRDLIFGVMLATLMLPAAVTLLPQFLVFTKLGWIDTLLPLWVPAFLGSAFNIFLLRQFFLGIPMELEDAAKVDGCSYLRTFWSVLLPQVKPALAVVAIWTFMGAWNNFMGPLIYINSPENMPLSYALQLFQSDRGLGEPGLLMAFATLTILPVLALFFFAQKYFIEGVALSGLGGR